MTASIDIVMASRGRPHRFAEMTSSAFESAACPEALRVICAVDDDDPMLGAYRPAIEQYASKVLLAVGKREFVPKLTAQVLRVAAADIYCYSGDDVNFRTRGWDDRVRAEMGKFGDGLGVIYTNDGMGRRKCQHFFVSHRWSEIVGDGGWSTLRHFGLDQWHEEIAQAVGRLVYLDDVVLEHKHAKHRYPDGRPKADNDETYRSKRRENWSGADMETFAKLAHIRSEQVARVRAAMATQQR